MTTLALLALLLLLCLLPSLTSCNRLNPFVLQYDGPRCSDIPIQHPFGFNDSQGDSRPLPGFSVACINSPGGQIPVLSLGDRLYQLLNMSLEGYVRILGGEITWNCNDNNTAEDRTYGIDLEGTPYTFSDTMNKFTATGCDAIVMIRGSDPPHTYKGGCMSFCTSLDDGVINGSCAGVGCCQTPVPRGLKSLRLEYMSKRKTNNSTYCSKVFIVDDEWFKFSTKDLRMGNALDEYRPVVLEWSIGTQTCEEVRRRRNNNTQFACVDKNSECYNATNGIGYRCNCSEGYAGNPYLAQGCEDIDECKDPNKNDCVWRCVNDEGSFHCTCPPGYSGNGRKQGTGCKRVSPLEIALGVGLALLVILLLVSILAYWGLKRMKIKKLKQMYFLQNGGLLLQQHISSRQAAARIFSSDELERATDNFNENRVLGHGGYGTVYKGILRDERVVAIKKSKVVDQGQMEQFINEVVILSQINHKNVVKLLGCCLETQVPLLVYEFISNGTLSHHVHVHDSYMAPMSWENRLRVAVETAGALAHLHSATAIPIIHRDVKSANILLDENYTAKVSDFGASRLVPYDKTHVTTLVQGTLGYLDPEYFQTSILTEKSDVYSFGVVVMELLTREKPISLGRAEEERNLASHFIMLLEENRLLGALDCETVEAAGERHLHAVAELTRRCLNLRGEDRPSMREVAVELNALRRLFMQHSA